MSAVFHNPTQYVPSHTTPVPLCGIILPIFIPETNGRLLHQVAFLTSLITFLIPIFPRIGFDKLTTSFQFIHKLTWIPFANIDIYPGIDGTPPFFISLTTFPIPLRIPISRNSVKLHIKEYTIRSTPPELLLILVPRVPDPVPFHTFSESILMPMMLIIGVRGSRERKIGAAYQSPPYTLPGSVFFSLAILAIHSNTGTTDVQVPPTTQSPFDRQALPRLGFLASFAVKVPMIPVHTRLPEAHVEAPTAGSVISAGVSPKLGGHGSPRSSTPTPPEASVHLTPLIHVISVIAIIYVSLTTLRQIDLKKIIAYPSVAHMAFVTLGISTFNLQAIEGSTSPMLSHGIVSSALPMRVGVSYDRHKTRIIKYYSGMIQVMPLFMSFPLIFTPANPSLPTTGGPTGESSVIVGLFQANKLISVLASVGMVLGAAYPIRLRNRIARGNPKIYLTKLFADVGHREIYMSLPLVFLTFFIGIYPEVIPDTSHMSVKNLIPTSTEFEGITIYIQCLTSVVACIAARARRTSHRSPSKRM